MARREYKLTNIGCIADLAIKLEPGVNILRGRNGAGKTTASNAIARATGAEVSLEKRDGSPRGEVTGPGVTLKIGAATRQTGEPDVSLVDTGALGTLIDPGVADPEAADRARLRALLRLVRLEVTREQVLTLAGGDEVIADAALAKIKDRHVSDLLRGAEQVREVAFELARALEAECERLSGVAETRAAEVAAIRTELGTIEGTEPEEARQALQDAAARHRELTIHHEARVALEAQQAEVRETLGDRPDAAAARAVADASAEAERALAIKVGKMREELAAAQAEWDAASRQTVSDSATANRTDFAAAAWDRRREILDRVVEGPSRGDVNAAEHAMAAARAALEIAEKAAQARAARALAAEASTQHREKGEAAKAAREAATTVWDRLGDILADSPARDLRVVDGRLEARVDGQWFDWASRMSHGQRVTAALRLVIAAFPGRALPLEDQFWLRLQPERKREFAEAVAAAGLYLVTEEPDDGDLRCVSASEVAAEMGVA